ncbi:flippase [Microbacterium dauci]|uniref:Flippase n=1 Tax=Microbacterium dauci TaxID=3048008 RepID=A0ABT6ZE66_9MICO|nr:flippase [Microbacterium sp. LX3-4]MDJ1114459.1 flippase [Microbacterium sp. LX3-4]
MTEQNGRRSILRNGLWASALGGVNSLAGAAVAFLLVLVLPVDQYGLYSYATSLAAIGMAVAQGGLASFAVRMLVGVNRLEGRAAVGLIQATRVSFAFMGYLLIVGISLTSGSFPTVAASLIAGLSLFARSGNGADFWYQARMLTRVPATIRIWVTLASLVARLVVLWLWPSVWLFLVLFVTETLVGTVVIWIRYLRDQEAPGIARPNLRDAISLAKRSLPLTLAGLANQVNLRGDVVVLQVMSGNAAVGVYSLAVRVCEVAQVLPSAFMNSTLPVLVATRDRLGSSHPEYVALLQRAYDRAFWAGVLVALPVGGIGTFVIQSFLGSEYEPAISVLWIQLITCPFVFMALVYSKWIIAEGKLWLSLVRHGFGALLNIALNIALIPLAGLNGAAVATLASYVFASYLSCFLSRESRLPGKQMSLAIVAPVRYMISALSWRKNGTPNE